MDRRGAERSGARLFGKDRYCPLKPSSRPFRVGRRAGIDRVWASRNFAGTAATTRSGPYMPLRCLLPAAAGAMQELPARRIQFRRIRAIMANMSTNSGPDVESTSFGAKFANKFPLLARAVVVGVWLEGAFVAFLGISRPLSTNQLGGDAHAYWLAGQGNALYDKAPGQIDAYLYSPAFATAIQPLALMPWPFFLGVWILLQSAVLVWLLRPLEFKWSIPIFLFCVPELMNGNIYILLAACAVLGLRRPGIWAFPILTKITGGIGLLWFAVRGEWKQVVQGVCMTVAIAGVSYLFSPSQWHAWLDFLLLHRDGTRDGSISFLVRCSLAIALIVIGARKQWRWLMAPAMVLAAPALALTTLAILTAIPRLTIRMDTSVKPVVDPMTTRPRGGD